MDTASEVPPSFAASVDASSLPPEYDGHRPPSTTSEPRPLTEREYTLETDGTPWAVLKVRSRPGGPATSVPFFVQGDPIAGTVELRLARTEHIRAVTIEARGEIFTAGQDPVSFLAQETTLWSTAMGDPGTSNSGTGSAKLKGNYVWPFSITLPDTVAASVAGHRPGSEYALPPSFSERTSPTYVAYKLVATCRRGRLRVDSTLSSPFAFLTRSRTPAPSALRQLAYREHSAPPGPKGDPEGWEVLGPQSVTGTVFESRQVEVSCSLALAKPLCYARGTFIPFSLTLGCSDADNQALDLFAARGSHAIRLMRALNVGSDAMDESKPRRTNHSFTTCVGQGVSWLSRDNNTASDVRRLDGEIALRGDLKPGFVFPRFCVKYYVTFEITAPGFSPGRSHNSSGGAPTFSREVAITTDAAPGPAPRSSVPPALQGHAASATRDCDDDSFAAFAASQRHAYSFVGFG